MSENPLHIQLGRVTDKLNRLIESYDRLRSINETLAAENEELDRENKRLASQVESLTADNEYLRISHKLASDPDQVVETRRVIAKMIRDIDKCVAMLKE